MRTTPRQCRMLELPAAKDTKATRGCSRAVLVIALGRREASMADIPSTLRHARKQPCPEIQRWPIGGNGPS